MPDGAIAVDGGANAGLVCVPVAQRLRERGGRAHAFEPRRTLFHALGGTVALNELDNLHLLNMGLASRNGTMTVPDIDDGQPAGAEPAARVDGHAANGTPAPTVRLDSLGLPRLDFLKLDVGGMEIDALHGALRGRVELSRSALLLRAGRREEAARATIASENVLTAAQFGLPMERLYDGQPLHGKRLLVISYGGVGDQLQYARYLHALDALGCAAVTVIVPAALADLMRHTFPRIEFVGAHGAWVDTSQMAHDYWCSFLVLAAQFGYAPAPAGAPAAYLSCPPERAAAWRERVARDGSAPGTRRIGLN
ncbi:FkbM family methyltransferase [Burkholderia sp. Bp9143]|uniref:FkbM family methyltransferase n=1 Tax=Burkholderia sp. Bp9143 TaxID=2184574 RepID=UPI0021AB57C8|nr:FkbM family methyltransferase [Burkholderia sp. Bp9143]